MRILIDLSYTQNEGDVITGIHLYGKSIVDYLINSGSIDLTISLLNNSNIDEKYLNNTNIKKVYLKSKKNTKSYWREISQIISGYDKVFFPYQVIEGKIRCVNNNTKLYMTIHDLTPLKEVRVNKINRYERLYKYGYKQKFKYYVKCLLRLSHIWYIKRKSNLKYNVKLAHLIFTDSEYSKEEIIKCFRLDENKVVNAHAFTNKTNASSDNSQLDLKDYYLLISANRYLKNAHMALFALDKLWSENKESRKAVVLGKLSQNIYKRIKNKDKLILLGYVSDSDLEYLYKNAYCFIFPSLSEGYGLPPSEAMKYGTKVICSNAMSLKELYYDTVLFNPYSIGSILDAVARIDDIDSNAMIRNYERLKEKQDSVGIIIKKYLMES